MRKISLCEKIKLARDYSGTPEGEHAIIEVIKELTPWIELLVEEHSEKLECMAKDDLMQEAYVIVLESVETYVLLNETDETYLRYLMNKISRCYEMHEYKESLRKRYSDLRELL